MSNGHFDSKIILRRLAVLISYSSPRAQEIDQKSQKIEKNIFFKVADRTADFRLLIFRENHAKHTCALEFGQFCRFRAHCLVPGGCHPIFRSV